MTYIINIDEEHSEKTDLAIEAFLEANPTCIVEDAANAIFYAGVNLVCALREEPASDQESSTVSYEFHEIGSLDKHEVSKQKSFLSQDVDAFRPVYAGRGIRFPHQATEEWISQMDVLRDWVFAQHHEFTLAMAAKNVLLVDEWAISRELRINLNKVLLMMGCRKIEKRSGHDRFWYTPPESNRSRRIHYPPRPIPEPATLDIFPHIPQPTSESRKQFISNRFLRFFSFWK